MRDVLMALLGGGVVVGLLFARAVAREVRALHGARPGANSREPVKESVIAVLHGSGGRRREVH